jgi:hypothetical protein
MENLSVSSEQKGTKSLKDNRVVDTFLLWADNVLYGSVLMFSENLSVGSEQKGTNSLYYNKAIDTFLRGSSVSFD